MARLRQGPGPAANGFRPAESSSRSSKCERARRAASRARPAYDAPLQHHRFAQPERASRYAYLRAPRFSQCAARLPWSGVSAGISRSAVASPFARGKLDPGREPPMLPGPGMPRRGVAPAFSVCVERARPPITPCAPAARGGTATQRCPLRDRFPQAGSCGSCRDEASGCRLRGAPWTHWPGKPVP